MANEITVQYQPDETNLYACVFNASKQVYDIVGANWEVWDDAQIDNYDVPLAENGGGGLFFGDFPSTIDAGRYTVVIYQGTKVASDTVIGASEIVWNGTSEEFGIDENGRVDVGYLSGSEQSALDLKDFADEGYDPSTNKIEGCKTLDDKTGYTLIAATEAQIDDIDTRTSRLDGLLEDVGGDRFTAKALEQAPTAEMDAAELHAALDSYTATGGDIKDIKDETISITAFLQADKVIDTSTVPWTLERRDKDTKAVLLRQTMKNTNGDNITSINNVLGRLEKA